MEKKEYKRKLEEIKQKMLEKAITEYGIITNKEDASVLGYIVTLIQSATTNNDGTISYCRFDGWRRNSNQWTAIRFMDKVCTELREHHILQLLNHIKFAFNFVVKEDKEDTDNSCGYYSHLFFELYTDKEIIKDIEKKAQELKVKNIGTQFFSGSNNIGAYKNLSFDMFIHTDVLKQTEYVSILKFFDYIDYLIKQKIVVEENDILNKQ